MPAPIVLFVYNRPYHTMQTIEALQKNELAKESELFIFSDAPKSEGQFKSVEAVRTYVKKIRGFKRVTIIERDQNWGLEASIIDGVTQIVEQYGKVVVLEDDIVTSPYFLRFMNDGLELYRDESRVASIHGYIYPLKNSDDLPKTFFIKGADCWGWATWDRAWEHFEPDAQKLLNKLRKSGREFELNFNNTYPYTKMLKDQINGKNSSWAIKWYASTFLRDMFTLYPSKSFVSNIGNEGSGTHSTNTAQFDSVLKKDYNGINKIDIEESLIARKRMEMYFRSNYFDFFRKITSRIKKIF